MLIAFVFELPPSPQTRYLDASPGEQQAEVVEDNATEKRQLMEYMQVWIVCFKEISSIGLDNISQGLRRSFRCL